MIDKIIRNMEEAVVGIRDGANVLIGGFGEAGSPTELIHALIRQGAGDLTLISNNAGNGHIGIAALLETGQVRKVICSYPRSVNAVVFEERYRNGSLELETVPQGTLAERIRAAGAGIGAFYTPTSVGTPLAEGKEVRAIEGRDHVLEWPLKADVALVKAETADRWGNLTYRLAARNFGPIMCMAATTTVVQVRRIVELGAIESENVVTPGIFVDRVIEVSEPINETQAVRDEVHFR